MTRAHLPQSLAALLCLAGTWLLAETPGGFALPAFYTQARWVEGFPIAASAKVQPQALGEAEATVRGMLQERPDILRQLGKNRIRLGIMAATERTLDLPEHADLAPAAYWNKRARGLGATKERPAVSAGEENVLNLRGDPYGTESILVHEFAHAIHLMAVNELDPTFDARLEKTYATAKAAGLWKKCYAMENSREYFAEGVQSWFGANRENDGLHNHVNTRAELEAYDPDLAALCREVFKDTAWQYVRSDAPARQDEPHLRGLQREKMPTFAWTAEETAAYEAVEKETK